MITLTVSANATGTHVHSLFFIGTAARPKCFDFSIAQEKQKFSTFYKHKKRVDDRDVFPRLPSFLA